MLKRIFRAKFLSLLIRMDKTSLFASISTTTRRIVTAIQESLPKKTTKEARLAEEARLKEEARLAEEARLEEEARLAEEARLKEEASLVEEAKLEAERFAKIAAEKRAVATRQKLLAERITLEKKEIEARLAKEAFEARLREQYILEKARLVAEAEQARLEEERVAKEIAEKRAVAVREGLLMRRILLKKKEAEKAANLSKNQEEVADMYDLAAQSTGNVNAKDANNGRDQAEPPQRKPFSVKKKKPYDYIERTTGGFRSV